MEAAPHPWPTLGVLLMRDGLVTKDELLEVLDEQQDTRRQRLSGRRLGELLIDRGKVSAMQVARLVAEQYELPFIELALDEIDLQVAALLDEEQARAFSAVPINRRADGSFLLAIADPSTVVFSENLRQILGSVPHFAVAGQDAVEHAITYVHRVASAATVADETVDSDVLIERHPQTVDPGDDTYLASTAVAHLWPPLGALLIRENLLSDEELEAALAQQRLSTSRRLGEILVERGVVAPATIARLVAEQYELPFVELDDLEIDLDVARLLPEDLAQAYQAVPIARTDEGSLDVAIADPTNVFYSDDLHTELKAALTFYVATPSAIEGLVARAHGSSDLSESTAVDPLEPVVDAWDTSPEHLAVAPVAPPAGASLEHAREHEEERGESFQLPEFVPASEEVESSDFELVRVVNDAVDSGATAIHLSHDGDEVRVRARVDGTLQTLGTFEEHDIGRVVETLRSDDALTVSVLSTKRGLKITILPPEQPVEPHSLDELGLTADQTERLRSALGSPGLVVVAGPSGSGLTSTLYAALDELAASERISITIDDAFDRVLDGVDQIEISDASGGMYAAALHALGGTDSDIVLVGEVTDTESAQAVLRLARTGRQVLAGVRAPDAITAALSLCDLALEREAVSSALRCIVAQRLLGTVCVSCRESFYASPDELVSLGLDANERRLLARGRGCSACAGTGLRGQQAIFEVLGVDDELRRSLIEGTADIETFGAAETLEGQAIRLCLDGLTTLDELERAFA